MKFPMFCLPSEKSQFILPKYCKVFKTLCNFCDSRDTLYVYTDIQEKSVEKGQAEESSGKISISDRCLRDMFDYCVLPVKFIPYQQNTNIYFHEVRESIDDFFEKRNKSVRLLKYLSTAHSRHAAIPIQSRDIGVEYRWY